MRLLDPFIFLTEGLRAGDLSGLVLPLVSIDEYASKIDDSAIVIGFYITDKDAADDLNRFIQRSAVDLLDAERSPAPDQNGHYMVFVEMLHDAKTASNIMHLVDEISPLCGIDRWKMQIRGDDEIISLTGKDLSAAIARLKHYDADHDNHDKVKESVLDFFENSDLDDVRLLTTLDESTLVLKRGEAELSFRLPAQDANFINLCAFDLSADALSRAGRIASIIGEGWTAHALVNKGGYLLNENSQTKQLFVIASV